jgi:hypothetical protein
MVIRCRLPLPVERQAGDYGEYSDDNGSSHAARGRLAIASADHHAAGLDCGAAPDGQSRTFGLVAPATRAEPDLCPHRPMPAENMTISLIPLRPHRMVAQISVNLREQDSGILF